jgi:hypothetical protein
MMNMVKQLSDYFREYSYGENKTALLQIYRRMWEDGYRLGEYGRYLRNPAQFEEERLFSILKDIGLWKSGKRWLDKGFDLSWNFWKIRNALDLLVNQRGTRTVNGRILSIIAVNHETKIPGFRLRSGSVILTVMYPDSYGIIDYKVWRAINDKWAEHYDLNLSCRFKEKCGNCYEVGCNYIQGTVSSIDFSLEECGLYFDAIRSIGVAENMNPRQVDMALWEYDEQRSHCRNREQA